MLTLEQLQNALVGKSLLFENHLNQQNVIKAIHIRSIHVLSPQFKSVLTVNKGLPDEETVKRAVLDKVAAVGEYKADFGNQFGWLSYKVVPDTM